MADVLIYCLRDPRTGEARYVGRTAGSLRDRLNGHCSDARRGKSTRCARWINALLREGIVPTVSLLEVCSEDTWEEAERWYIDMARKAGMRMTNLQVGGRSNGPINPDRDALSKRMKGNRYAAHPHRQETKDRISATMKGRPSNNPTGNRGRVKVVIDGRTRFVHPEVEL